jgi:hypothetical protein
LDEIGTCKRQRQKESTAWKMRDAGILFIYF